MDKNKETKKIELEETNKKVKELLLEINKKKEIIRAFKKRHIKYIDKNKEKKIEIINIKLFSLNSFINEFEKLIQLSLELILSIQEAFKQISKSKIKKDELNNFVHNNKKCCNIQNISNLDIIDKIKYEKYSRKYINKLNNNNSSETFNNDNQFQHYFYMNSTFNNFRNYYSVNNLLKNNDINRNNYSLYNFENNTLSLKERTLRTLYNSQYNSKNNKMNEEKKINELKIKIPLRNALRVLIKENKLYNK